MGPEPSLWRKAAEFEQLGTPFVIVTLIARRGHVPADVGAKALITESGLVMGTVGGGKVEARAINHAKTLLSEARREPDLQIWNLQKDVGMTCGGEATYLFESHRPALWQVAIFGAGHVAQALIRVLLTLDVQILCVDARPEWVEKLPAHPKLRAVAAAEPARWVGELKPGTAILSITQGHATDLPILAEVFRVFPDVRYVGAIGSDVKARKLRADLREKGYTEAQVARLRCPVGLPIGGNHPNEIAISIAAELLQNRESPTHE